MRLYIMYANLETALVKIVMLSLSKHLYRFV